MTGNNLLQSSIPEVFIPGLLRLHVCDSGMHFKILSSSVLLQCCSCQALHNKETFCAQESS